MSAVHHSRAASSLSRTRRVLLAVVGTIVVMVLLMSYRTSTMGAGSAALSSQEPVISSSRTSAVAGTSGSGSTGSSPTSGRSAATSGSPSPSASASAKQTVTGPVVPTRYGPVQVQLTVDGGTITDAAVLQYPNADSRDAQINGYALPILTRETVDKQSAQIDMVSGATYTSAGYTSSLQAALDQAGL